MFFSACDAHMRDYNLIVPQDCVMAIDEHEHRFALNQMKKYLNAETQNSKKLKLL